MQKRVRLSSSVYCFVYLCVSVALFLFFCLSFKVPCALWFSRAFSLALSRFPYRILPELGIQIKDVIHRISGCFFLNQSLIRYVRVATLMQCWLQHCGRFTLFFGGLSYPPSDWKAVCLSQ